MKLNNKDLHTFFLKKNILVLYHANTVTTSKTYFEQDGILSRGAIEDQGLIQTPQNSDEIDKVLGVWHDVFLDTTDLHSFFQRQNYYGPLLYEFDVDLLLNEEYEMWITKNNPIHWETDLPNNERYFESVQELESNWDKYPRQRMMITIRNNNKPILFEYIRRIIIDDPRVKLTDDSIHFFNEAKKKIRSVVTNEHRLNGKITVRNCNSCWCRDNYLNQVSTDDLKRLFL